MRPQTLICFLLAFILLSAFAFAQVWPNAEDIVGKIQTTMNLSQEQLAKVRIIFEENMAKRQQIRPQLDSGLTEAQAEPLDSELYTKLSEVLTRPQMYQWEGIKDNIFEKQNAIQSIK